MKYIALIYQFIGYKKYNIKLVAIKSNFTIMIISNYYVFQITIIYVNHNNLNSSSILILFIVDLFNIFLPYL